MPSDTSEVRYIEDQFLDFAHLSETQKLILHNSTKKPRKRLQTLSEAARFFMDFHQNGITSSAVTDPNTNLPFKIVGSFIVPNNYGKVFAGGVIREDKEAKDPLALLDDGDDYTTHDKNRILNSSKKKVVRAWVMRRDTPQKLRPTITDIYYVFFNSIPDKEERELIKSLHGPKTIIVMVDDAGNELFKRLENFDTEEETNIIQPLQYIDPGDDRDQDVLTYADMHGGGGD